MRTQAAERVDEQRGAAAVELALVLPVLLMLLVGIVEFGRGYNTKLELTAAVREGARAAAVGGTQAAVATAVADASGALQASRLQVTAPASACADGTQVAVTASYPFTWRIPFVAERTVTLRSRSVMRCGG